MKAKANAAKSPEIVNAQQGDQVIDYATKNMKQAKDGKVSKDDEALNKKGGKAPIVVLAHGDKAESKGKVYAIKFTKKTPQEMFKFMTKTKKLPENYAGTLYLDGCFTAAGKTDENYAKKVYKLFEKAGCKYMKVVGNLGPSATQLDGHESFLDAQEEKRLEAEAKKKLQTAEKSLVIIKKKHAIVHEIWNHVEQRYRDEGNYLEMFDDPMIKKLSPELSKLGEKVIAHTKFLAKAESENKRLKNDLYGMKYDNDDLIGTFGPAEIQKDSRFKELFN